MEDAQHSETSEYCPKCNHSPIKIGAELLLAPVRSSFHCQTFSLKKSKREVCFLCFQLMDPHEICFYWKLLKRLKTLCCVGDSVGMLY